jgi:hypothetical protein
MQIGVTAPFVSAAVWILLFRKFPSWVSFFPAMGKLPTPLKKLWRGWTDCAYCGGFWVALLVRYLTGLKFLMLNGISPIVDWSLDALTVGFVTLLLIRTSDALAAAAGG